MTASPTRDTQPVLRLGDLDRQPGSPGPAGPDGHGRAGRAAARGAYSRVSMSLPVVVAVTVDVT
ncbi:hypothetical protein JCM9957A_51930 [Kineosporia succinea]|uniref:Uncharacterized protein n=1 Tax=Kineosporia succinea TaxID=84632 RepID=A0ABT9PCP2_9ACTN|nr:hypothetical protein [Kineosporia succinea]